MPEMSATIPFTQFLRPMGERRNVYYQCSVEEAATAAEIISYGYEFQCEELMNGMCSFTIFDPRTEEDVGIAVCMNGPPVEDAIHDMLGRFFKSPDELEALHPRSEER